MMKIRAKVLLAAAALFGATGLGRSFDRVGHPRPRGARHHRAAAPRSSGSIDTADDLGDDRRRPAGRREHGPDPRPVRADRTAASTTAWCSHPRRSTRPCRRPCAASSARRQARCATTGCTAPRSLSNVCGNAPWVMGQSAAGGDADHARQGPAGLHPRQPDRQLDRRAPGARASGSSGASPSHVAGRRPGPGVPGRRSPAQLPELAGHRRHAQPHPAARSPPRRPAVGWSRRHGHVLGHRPTCRR